VTPHVSRRTLLTAGPLAFAACKTAQGAYFGKTEPPSNRRLVYEIGGEPESLDPHQSIAGTETYIIPSMFEGLVTWHPKTSEPLAGIATHYESSLVNRRFTFYLRGHPNPRGLRLPGMDTLEWEFTGEKQTLPRRLPARFSDGVVITAHDFVYSWRRAVEPATACALINFMFCVLNAPEINAGKRPADELGVRALDDYTLQVDTHAPTPFFLSLQFLPPFYVVPQHAIEAARLHGNEKSWTEPKYIVTSGPFTLDEWKPYEYIRLTRNADYHDAAVVGLDEIVLLPVVKGDANLNLYKAGEADSMLGKLVAPVFLPLLSRKRDFNATPAFWTMFYVLNTTRPPFNNVLVRYALNMAIEKRALTGFLGAGQRPAFGLVPRLEGYPGISSLPVDIDGATCDVLAYNPSIARDLLAKAGIERPRIEILYPNHPASQDLPLILRQQWQDQLNAEVVLVHQEQNVWHQNRNALQYKGVAERGWWGDYLDPNTFLDPFTSGPSIIGSGWSDPRYDTMLQEANAAVNPSLRMQKLAECERFLLRAMPFLPLYHNVQAYLQKPYVRGLPAGQVDAVSFKYAWIDTNWKPERS
jgi:ABC-type oligopeptide transport system substrate-binding subunit